jgi:hypothetical protein
MPMEKKVLTQKEKELKKKEQEFNKHMNQVWKLRPYKINGISKNVGKAPKCNTKVKTERPVEMVNQKKKKK